MSKKKSVFDFYEMKKKGQKVSWLTAYDYPTAQLAEAAGLEMPFGKNDFPGAY